MSDTPFAGLSQQKSLAQLVEINLLVSFEKGDQRGALEGVADLLRISTALEEFVPGYSHGAAAGVSEMACNRVIELAPRLSIGSSESEVSRDEVLKVIRMLADETALTQGNSWRMKWLRANDAETVAVMSGRCSIFSSSQGDPLPLRVVAWAAKPSAMSSAREILKLGSAVLKIADESEDWPAFRSAAADVLGKLREVDGNRGWGSLICPSSPLYERMVKYHFQSLGDRRLAATALAMRLYAVEHEGKLPANIEALAPDYLEHLPADLFARRGRLMGYAGDAKRPVIYSIGENGRDDGGSDRSKISTTDCPRWEMEDAVVDLSVRVSKKILEDDSDEDARNFPAGPYGTPAYYSGGYRRSEGGD